MCTVNSRGYISGLERENEKNICAVLETALDCFPNMFKGVLENVHNVAQTEFQVSNLYGGEVDVNFEPAEVELQYEVEDDLQIEYEVVTIPITLAVDIENVQRVILHDSLVHRSRLKVKGEGGA